MSNRSTHLEKLADGYQSQDGMLRCAVLDVMCSAVRDAAIECLEEVYRVYGEQLMDVLSSHQLRPAHLNLIYNRLAQMGAAVEHSPGQSCTGVLLLAWTLSSEYTRPAKSLCPGLCPNAVQ